MNELSLLSQISLYVLMFLMGVIALLIFIWQVNVLKGKAMKNPDGSLDSWHEQKILYGIAVADLILACPATIAGILLVFIWPQWGYYLLTLVSFWVVWANIMTPAASLRFEKPKISLNWFIAFPFSILLGIAYIIWTIVHFNIIYVK
ncbi:MAG: hypothetical protein K8R79_07400 [Calditrichales bacterium]|nr:hypothetical protein [Calditrichales bacterium]